jgi:hypothetical protein
VKRKKSIGGLKVVMVSYWRRRDVLFVIVFLICGTQLRAEGTTGSVPEYEVKAAMLYNFALFIEWPVPGQLPVNTPFLVGVLGADPFGSVLENAFRGKTVRGREIQVRRFAGLDVLQTCDILFVSQSERKRMPEIINAIGRDHVLTIGDMQQFTELGGVIGFKIEDKEIRFDINLEGAQRAGLKISYKLLRLALPHAQAALRQE